MGNGAHVESILVNEGAHFGMNSSYPLGVFRRGQGRERVAERVVGGVLPRINIGAWCLCDRLCLVLVCRGRYGLGGGTHAA